MNNPDLLIARDKTLVKTLIIDQDGIITHADPAFCDFLNKDESLLVNTPLSDLVDRPMKIGFINQEKIDSLVEKPFVDLSFVLNECMKGHFRCSIKPIGKDGYQIIGFETTAFVKEMENHNLLKRGLSHSLRAPLTTSLGLLNLIDMSLLGEDDNLPIYVEELRNTLQGMELKLTNLEQTSMQQNLNISCIDFKKKGSYLTGSAFSDTTAKPSLRLHVQQEGLFYHDIKRIADIFSLLGKHIAALTPDESKDFKVAFHIKCDKTHCLITAQHNGIRLPEGVRANIFKIFANSGHSKMHDELYVLNHAVTACNGVIKYQSCKLGSTFLIEIPNMGA